MGQRGVPVNRAAFGLVLAACLALPLATGAEPGLKDIIEPERLKRWKRRLDRDALKPVIREYDPVNWRQLLEDLEWELGGGLP